MARQDT